MSLKGHHELQRADQIRSHPVQQPVSLYDPFDDRADVPVLEIAQAAVDHFRGQMAGSGSEIIGLDQKHRQPAHGGVTSDTDTGDSSAENEAIDLTGHRFL